MRRGCICLLCLAYFVGALSTANVSVLELEAKNFLSELGESRYAGDRFLIEFYAHWCPHCQHYKPTFEGIGSFFMKKPRPRPHIWVARIDCALTTNSAVCNKFKVVGFPTLYLGKVKDFIDARVPELTSIPAEEPSKVLDAINAQLGSEYSLEEKKFVQELRPVSKARTELGETFDMDDVERATVELFEHVFQSALILTSKKVRTAFAEWVELLAEAHPSPRCRQSFRFLCNQMGTLWPESSDAPSLYLSRFHVCTVDYEKKEWASCAGSLPGTRGFTCGVWQLLHALSVGVADSQTQLWMRGVRAFAEYFFGCTECAKHFLRTLDNRATRQITSRRELVLWIWSIHNLVNDRLSKEERESGMADPDYPKVQWPPINTCRACHLESVDAESPEWDRAKVLHFLQHFYAMANAEDPLYAFSRKELYNGSPGVRAADVFSREDAAAIELLSREDADLMLYVLFVAMAALAVYLIRKSRRHKIVPNQKDLV